MLTITITFAVLVALWGFSGTLVSFAKRALAQRPASPRPAPAPARPRPARAAASRPRGARPIASAGR